MTPLVGETLSVAQTVLAVLPLYLLHLVIYRLDGRRSINGSFAITFAIGCPTFLALGVAGVSLSGAWSWDAAARLAVDLAIFVGCAYVYVDFLNFGESSIRTRILDEVDRGPGGRLSLGELLARYDARAVMELRIQRLIGNGQLARRGGRLVLGPNRHRQLLLARSFRWLRRLLFRSDAITSRATRTDEDRA